MKRPLEGYPPVSSAGSDSSLVFGLHLSLARRVHVTCLGATVRSAGHLTSDPPLPQL